MIRGTGDNGGRDFCLYPGQRHCQLQQHYTRTEKRHKGAPFLLRNVFFRRAEWGVQGSQLTPARRSFLLGGNRRERDERLFTPLPRLLLYSHLPAFIADEGKRWDEDRK